MSVNKPSGRSHEAGELAHEIERLKAWYATELAAGRLPDMVPYLQRYPQYADELRDYVVYLHTVAVDLPAPEAEPGAELSSAARTALARIHDEGLAKGHAASAERVESLVSLAAKVGVKPPQLASRVGINLIILTRLQNGLISPQSVPATLVQRIAAVLAETPAKVEALLGLRSPTQGAFFYADTAPERTQETFLNAVRRSTLTDEQKQEWNAIVAQDVSKEDR